jgi:hypothetical protein
MDTKKGHRWLQSQSTVQMAGVAGLKRLATKQSQKLLPRKLTLKLGPGNNLTSWTKAKALMWRWLVGA